MSNIFETIKIETVPIEENDNILGAEIILASGEEMVAIDIPEENQMCENEFVTNRRNDDFPESYIFMLTDGSFKFLEDFPEEESTFIENNNLKKSPALSPENQVQCSYERCGKKFLSTSQLKSHERKHSGGASSAHECDFCGKSFSTGYALKAHRRTHTGEKPYMCPEVTCQKKFKTSGDLQKHVRTHTGERPFKCGVCSKAFNTSNIRKVHMRIHTGEKPYACPHAGCPRRFSSSTNFRNHKRIHTGEKPYVCSVQSCQKRFTEYSSLYKHYTVHSQKKQYECTFCGQQYRQLSTLNIHINTIHKASLLGAKEDEEERYRKPKNKSDDEGIKITGTEEIVFGTPQTDSIFVSSSISCASSSSSIPSPSSSSLSCNTTEPTVVLKSGPGVDFEPLKAITCGSEAILVLSVPSSSRKEGGGGGGAFVSN